MRTTMPTSRPDRRRARRRAAAARPGFTLLETSLSIIIIGVGVLAILEAQQAFLVKNAWSTQTTTGTLLANEIREMTRGFPRHDVFTGGLYFEDPATSSGLRGWGPEPLETQAIDFDDYDDLDGVMFGDAADADGRPINLRLPGPIDAARLVIPETNWLGESVAAANGGDEPMQGWSQYVQVDKVEPGDFTIGVPDDDDALAEVDEYPLRVTVFIFYQGPFDVSPSQVAQTSWVVLP